MRPKSATIFCPGRRMCPICKEERRSQAAGAGTRVKGLGESADAADAVQAAEQGGGALRHAVMFLRFRGAALAAG